MKPIYTIRAILAVTALVFFMSGAPAYAWPYAGESNLFDLSPTLQDVYFSGESNIFALTDLGTLRVFIEPASARGGGAQWRRVGTTKWRDSGYTDWNTPLGSQMVEFKNILGWSRPMSQRIIINQSETAQTTAIYTPAAPDKALLEGVIGAVSAQGQLLGPISGAVVELTGHGTSTSDDQGRYGFPGVNPGTYSVIASKVGYYPVTRSVTLKAGEALTEVFRMTLEEATARPVITDFSSPNGRHFVRGMPGELSFQATISWHGSPGSARYRVGGVWFPASVTNIGNGTALAKLTISAPGTLSSNSEMILEVINGEGTATTQRMGVYFYDLPSIIANWYKSSLNWRLTGSKISHEESLSLTLWDLSFNEVYESSSDIGFQKTLSFDPRAGTFSGSFGLSGGFSHKLTFHGVEISLCASISETPTP
jgi:hypothetical protein